MTQIIAFAGKKSSGKTTAANFVFGITFLQLDKIDHFSISKDGKLVVPITGGKYADMDFASPPNQIIPEMIQYLEDEIWPYIKVYNFADPLKEYCMSIFGLTYEQCYGSNQQKNSDTEYLWENMPIKVKNKSGKMTARELLQYWGTEIMRSIDDNIWVKATLRKIHYESPQIAIIGDCRFPNEVEGIKGVGGKVIRLTRNQDSKDNHASETALDPKVFDWSKFDEILDNSELNIEGQSNEILNILIRNNIFNGEVKAQDGVFSYV